MDRLARELELAAEELNPNWNEERSAQLFDATHALGKKRAAQRTAYTTVFAAAALALIGWVSLRGAAPSTQVAQQRPAGEARSNHTLLLADGSRAELVGAQSELEVTHNSKQQVGLALVSGRAHFEVVHDPLRSFVVEARPYRVEVIGTVFDVERDGRNVSVGVTRGKVRVYGPQGAEDVVAGQIKHWPAAPSAAATAVAPAAAEPTPDEEAPAENPAPEDRAAHPHARANKRAPTAIASWRSLSQSGQYEAAFDALQHTNGVENDPAALMDAADAARLSGHAQDAVQYLARVVVEHKRSPVAPLAAFTLGRVYLDKLGQPDKAAEAFETARALAPNGSLAQDALAREVEALSKGGNAQKAYVRAREYLKQYPNGRRLRAVQLYGGIE
jgi:transmembrane sensor